MMLLLLLRIHLARFVFGRAMLSSVVILIRRTKGEDVKITVAMDEGRKRVLAIIAGILVASHLKTTEDLFDNRGSPKTEAMVAAAVQWADRIMRKIDNVFGMR